MKYLILLLEIIMTSIGLTFIIIYLNLLVMGYTFVEFLKYIFSRFECISFFVGYILIIITIFYRRKI